MNVESVRAALAGTRTLFLLNAVTADELTQALIALNLAREAGIERVVYFSVIHSDRYVNVPHFAGKYTAERMIIGTGLPATILRPAYFMENDAALKELDHGRRHLSDADWLEGPGDGRRQRHSGDRRA